MKNEKIKKWLLPVGLLIMGSSYLTQFFMENPIDVRDFLIGLGFAFVASAFFFKVRTKMSH